MADLDYDLMAQIKALSIATAGLLAAVIDAKFNRHLSLPKSGSKVLVPRVDG